MRILDIILGVVLLVAAVVGAVVHLRIKRRLAAAEAAEDDGDDDDAAPVTPAALAEVGFAEPIEDGARGSFGGVTIEAVTWSGKGGDGFTLSVELPDDARRFAVSATAQGLERSKKSLVLGLPGPDARLDVRGDEADARALFGATDARALIDAIALHGWVLSRGELSRVVTAADVLEPVVQSGAAAGRVLLAVAAGYAPRSGTDVDDVGRIG
ncbi:MAG: hypothetical protein U1F43_21560 [Myxococcota bacterium]